MKLFTRCHDDGLLHPSLRKYLDEHPMPATAKLVGRGNKKKFEFFSPSHGCVVSGGGIHNAIRKALHPHFNPKTQKTYRRSKKVQVVGSSQKEGKLVDRQLAGLVDGSRSMRRLNAKTQALYDYWMSKGHTLQAAQVPVQLPGTKKATMCDVITKDAQGRLWVWEVKCGFPEGLFTKHQTFKAGTGFEKVDCTKFNIWQLQVHFTAEALIKKAGLPIYQYHVIQVFNKKNETKPLVRVHERAAWLPKIL